MPDNLSVPEVAVRVDGVYHGGMSNYITDQQAHYNLCESIIDQPYCDLCETEGHTARSCPARDDDTQGW